MIIIKSRAASHSTFEWRGRDRLARSHAHLFANAPRCTLETTTTTSSLSLYQSNCHSCVMWREARRAALCICAGRRTMLALRRIITPLSQGSAKYNNFLRISEIYMHQKKNHKCHLLLMKFDNYALQIFHFSINGIWHCNKRLFLFENKLTFEDEFISKRQFL
jgi:hypothetical protein